jgi:hypothetical protein
MNRRRFLRTGITGIALGAGGFLFARRGRIRADITSRMLDDALLPLSNNAVREMNTLPALAREEIRRYFHGKCLNVESFVSHVSSNEFVERLGRCHTQDERELCFLQAFCSRVTTEAELLSQVETIAATVGNELDSGWASYCNELSAWWNTRIQGHGTPLAVDDLSVRLGEMIRGELIQAARRAESCNQKPVVGDTIGKICQSAVLLLPLVRFGKVGLAVGIPVFVILAAKHIWDYATAQREDRNGDYQAGLSSRLALLGNRVSAEFEREVRERLTDLHTWQERSIRNTATHLAEERIGLI